VGGRKGSRSKDTLAIPMSSLRVLLYVWTLPNTLLGLVLGALSFRAPRVIAGILAFEGSTGSLWVVRRFRRSAVTYGHVVLSARPLQGRLLAHELHHVRQYERLGILYIPVYVLIWLFTGYRRHPLEAAARRAEQLAADDGPAGATPAVPPGA
jgi:hypothetical protein